MIKVWSMEEKRCLKTLKRVHTGWINTLKTLRRTIFSGSTDSLIKKISYEDLVNEAFQSEELRGHTNGVTCLEIHGNHLISGSHDKTVKIWNIADRSLLTTLTFEDRPFCLHAFAQRLYVGLADSTAVSMDIHNPEKPDSRSLSLSLSLSVLPTPSICFHLLHNRVIFSRGFRNAVSNLLIHEGLLFTTSANRG